MSDCDKSEFDDRLLELNSWQIEQQKKLKKFQEAQRKLLDSEHEKILSSLKTQNYDQRHEVGDNDHVHFNRPITESDGETQSKSLNSGYVFNFKSDVIKLKDPKINLCSISQFSQSDKSDELFGNSNEGYEETETSRPKRFLRRGDGLARFRMTLDDFKSPPGIYKEKRIKTYLNQKPDFSRKPTGRIKTVKSVKEISRKRPCNKPRAVPVNIYVASSKSKNVSPVKSTCDSGVRPNCSKMTKVNTPKCSLRALTLKPVPLPNYNKKELDNENTIGNCEKPAERSQTAVKSPEKTIIERQIKKDERELRMFEMLEGKIDDGSLSPNSSLVARFMEESLCSTPSKLTNGDCEKDVAYSYLQSLRELQRQYLTPEQINRIQECSEEYLSEETLSESNAKMSESPSSDIIEEDKMAELNEKEMEDISGENKDEEQGKESMGKIQLRETPPRPTSLFPEANSQSKTILQEYIQNFKKLKNEMKESCQSECEDLEESLTSANSPEAVNDQGIGQREIAIKLQRKALQDNVKNLLNWEGQPRKKQPKKVAKKTKAKCLKLEKPKKVDKSEEDRIVLNSSLLKERLEELEKEIVAFKRENTNLTRLQKECDAEKCKLEKERRDFERYMEQEREKWEAKLNEEQRKLQRDKRVFEKYCKDMKNQPSKKEREEVTSLKKEVERLTEAMATKDSRWGASQARLRNQIKQLERENAELKSEIDKLKKQNGKKVTFDGGKNMNTKIIHAINSELGKLKPHLVKNGSGKQKYQSLTARVDTNLQRKPMRRIKSVPDLKKSSPDKENSNECGENILTSLASVGEGEKGKLKFPCLDLNKSDPSRFDTNFDPLLSDEPTESAPGFNSDAIMRNSSCDFGTVQSKDGNGNLMECPEVVSADGNKRRSNSDCSKDMMEAVLHETFFDSRDCGDHNGTITEIKRRLEKLNLLHSLESYNGEGDISPRNHQTKAVGSNSDGSCDSRDIDVDEEEIGPPDVCSKKPYGQYLRRSSSCLNHFPQPKVECNGGVREKKFEDGRKEIYYPNGNIKKISSDARIVKMMYYNGDVKETDVAEGSEKYFYAETKTWHTTYKDGLEVLEFPNGQTERRHPDGSTEILFPNGCVRYCDPSGKDEWRFLDGTVIKTDKNGHKVLLLPNGQKEVHTKEYKKREYPDGTVKLLYADGTQETRYATGRVRLKDKDGNLVMDSGGIR